MKDLTQGQQLVVEQLVAELTNLNESQYIKHEIDRRITLAREDAQDLFNRIKEEMGECTLAQEFCKMASNIDIALDFNDDESNDWLTKEQFVDNKDWATSRRGNKVSELYVTESDIEFSATELGSQTSGYNLKCYDGYAVGSNGLVSIRVAYPRLSDMSDTAKNDCLWCRYGKDAKLYDIHFGDVMMAKGKLESFKLL